MVSFSCEGCGDVLTKKSLDKHRNQCRGASFTCLDCMVHFHGTEYKFHTSCITEAQKVQGGLYKEKEKKGDKRRAINGNGAMVPQRAYVEDAPEGDDSQAMVIVDVPPRAPTPPTAPQELPENVNVFDFLVSEETPNGNKSVPEEKRVHYANGDSQYSQYTNDASQFSQTGFSYGNAPIEPSFSRYDSWHNLADSQQSQGTMPPPAYVTPLPKEHRRERTDRPTTEKSDKKRKRQTVEGLDLSSAKRPTSRDGMMLDAPGDGRNGRVLHSGLTGGLNKLITDPEFLEDRIDAGPTPILSPIKRTKREETDKKSRRASSYISYSAATSKPNSSKHADDRHDRSRDIDRKHHDDKHNGRRHHSAERSNSYHDDNKPRHHHHHRRHRESLSSDDRPSRKHMKAIEYHPTTTSGARIDRPASVQPNANNQLVSYSTRADLFLSFITKGPDSERGCSINKVLKRYHRERDVRGGGEKEEEMKELWKALRVRRNERGEIVLFL